MEAQNLSWVLVSSAAQQKAKPPTIIAVVSNMHRQLPYFPFYSPLSHKVRFSKRMGGAFFLPSHMVADREAGCHLLAQKDEILTITATPQRSYRSDLKRPPKQFIRCDSCV